MKELRNFVLFKTTDSKAWLFFFFPVPFLMKNWVFHSSLNFKKSMHYLNEKYSFQIKFNNDINIFWNMCLFYSDVIYKIMNKEFLYFLFGKVYCTSRTLTSEITHAHSLILE